jgi:hypothetical protein
LHELGEIVLGLSIQVGGFEEQEIYESLSAALVEAGLPPHSEPDIANDSEIFSCQMWGYSGLHYLRRLAAYLAAGKDVPGPGDDSSAEDPVLADFYDLLAPGFEHLLMHSDAEGFYAPLDFKDVIFPSEELRVPGEMIGSSVQLLQECKRLAEWLELPLDLDPESDEVWDAADSPQPDGPKWKQYGVESFSCMRLIKAAEASIDSGAALVFC